LTNASIFNHLKINFCLRNDQILTKAIDYYLSNGDQSGERNLSNLNYSTAITYGVKNTSISLLHCTGTESPTLNEFSNNPDGVGGFNYSLEAMQSKNYELNIKSDIANKLNFQFSIFNINTTDEILPYELINTPGRFYYRNTGSTKRNGLEFEASYKVFHNLSVKSSYTFSNFKFEDYQNLRDKYLPGIPKNLFFMELKYQFNERLKVLIEHKIIDEIFLNDLNEVTTPSFNETNIKCGYKYSIGKIETQINAGINNLLNSNYYSNIRINAAGGRYYEAAMPRYFFTAINFKL
jgi:iron complex outermembrane receptor protein